MRVIPLRKSPVTYSCNSYLILGEWNRIEDVNTVIDPGIDDYILGELAEASTGFGKRAVAQIILTHSHFDHCAGMLALKRRYSCRVYAFGEGAEVDETLRDGQFVNAGDDCLEVLHTPGHSSDSICLYAPALKALFSGDTQLRVRSSGGSYSREYLEAMRRLAGMKIERVYSGHDQPVLQGGQEMILRSLALIEQSSIT